MRAAFRSRAFVLMAFGCGLGRIGLTLAQGGLVYFVVYQLQGSKSELPRILGQLLLVVALSIPLWKALADHWEKHTVYIIGLCVASLGFATLFWLKPGQPWATFAALSLIGLGMGAHWVVPSSMLPDTIDFAHAQTGEHRTGMYYGLFGLIDKLARTLGTVAIGWMLQLFGYVPNVAQTADALLGIRLMVGVLPALFVLAAVPLFLAYPISRARHAALRA
jgi:GPH family glycoside/pentoside/hexuronide:cation symporter